MIVWWSCHLSNTAMTITMAITEHEKKNQKKAKRRNSFCTKEAIWILLCRKTVDDFAMDENDEYDSNQAGSAAAALSSSSPLTHPSNMDQNTVSHASNISRSHSDDVPITERLRSINKMSLVLGRIGRRHFSHSEAPPPPLLHHQPPPPTHRGLRDGHTLNQKNSTPTRTRGSAVLGKRSA